MAVIKPNFLIVGAPKCGTTSMYNYLNQHREVYMSPVKEPKFFIRDTARAYVDRNRRLRHAVKELPQTVEEYFALFSKARDEKVIGEATAWYLAYYEEAIPKIKKCLGDVAIIIVLRNPIERAYSAYYHLIREGLVSLSFEDALQEEEVRTRHIWIDLRSLIRGMSLYYRQVRAYRESFSRVNIVLYEDLRDDCLDCMRGIYGFLGVDTSFIPDVGFKYNATGPPRFRIVTDIVARPNGLKRAVGSLLPKKMLRELRDFIISKNVARKPPMARATRAALHRFFQDDVLRLEELIGVDLAHWV